MEENNIDNNVLQDELRNEALLIEEKRKSEQEVEIKSEEDNKNSSSGIKMVTNKLLKNSITYLFVTFSFSLFYSYAHVFLNGVLPKFFSPPGNEWVPNQMIKNNPGLAGEMGKKFGIVEKPFLGCGCFLHLIIIIGLIAFIYFMFNKWSILLRSVADWTASLFA